MSIYIKKPVRVEAFQLPSLDCQPEPGLVKWLHLMDQVWFCERDGCISIRTLEGEMTASPGDYVIKGVNGEYYPCKPDIFHKTYYTEEEYAKL